MEQVLAIRVIENKFLEILHSSLFLYIYFLFFYYIGMYGIAACLSLVAALVEFHLDGYNIRQDEWPDPRFLNLTCKHL